MTKKPAGDTWGEFTKEQSRLLDRIDFYGNNAWSRNSQSEVMMPAILGECANAGLDLGRIKSAMVSVGYSSRSVHQLDRWESRRLTGKFGV